MATTDMSYHFARSQRGLFTEIYFPKRAAYYGTIFDALRHGYEEGRVKKYLRDNLGALPQEFQAFPSLFDPREYQTTRRRKTIPSVVEADTRIEMYRSPFKGWSVYSVDGVWFDGQGRPIEEATQVVRVIFRLESSYTDKAKEADCLDVLRSILFWVIGQQGRPDIHKGWSKAEMRHYLTRHTPWIKHKRVFAQENFTKIAQEVAQWMGDRALFIFCYLVRQFWEQVLKEKMDEAEIWVASSFDLQLNVIKRIESPQS
jgi:hypothetical protein